uniref:4-substituted benzoates-glutamate ligase GH3.12 n=4 Tax=Noccaea caerulescens TaxID=107243 RepID=A0A1J3I750_NOCCA
MTTLTSELKDLEELTLNAKQIQDDMLEEILRVNANTEYLQRFLHGSSDKKLFQKNVPMVSYEDVKPYIERVANGEPSHVISGEPITYFSLSSGTSGGKQKLFPTNNKYFENLGFIQALCSAIISKYIDGIKEGKVIKFMNTRPLSTTPSGLHVAPALTGFLKSDCFKNRPSKCYTSPDEVILCVDDKQSMFCHLLCGLVQRATVVSMAALFASTLVQAIRFLETHWKELCANIRSGHVSDWITDLTCRESVSAILGGTNLELADLIEHECSQSSWEGIIIRLWPNIKFIESISTGQMSQYIPVLEFYSNKLPLISPFYGASEAMFGVNVDPLCNPQDVSYTFIPTMSYFEFVRVDEGNIDDEIVDLVDVKLGCSYEVLVTNHVGLYRYRMGDILEVTGFYNSAPQFRFVRRKNVVVSVHVEATTEEDLLKALSRAAHVIESSGLMLMGFTCYSDISTVPGHYVLYWELKARKKNGIVKLDDKVIVECCYVVEESLDIIYRKLRSKYDSIGALEIRVVEQGTFDSLMEYFISKGASSSQYKTPLCVNSPQVLAILEEKVVARFFSDKPPPL